MKPSQTSTPKPEDDSGELAGFDSTDAICAYVFHREGEAGLRWVIEQAFDPNEQPKHDYGPREHLEDAALELQRRGLDKPAAVLFDHAKNLRSGFEVVPDYVERAGPQFVEAWRDRWRQQRQIELGTFKVNPKRENADKAHQSRTTTEKPASHKH